MIETKRELMDMDTSVVILGMEEEERIKINGDGKIKFN